jgi:hypothetical protein
MRGVDVQTHVFLISALVGGEWPAFRLGHFTPGVRTPIPIGYEIEWAPEPVWKTWRSENSYPHRDSNSHFSVVQPVASRCRTNFYTINKILQIVFLCRGQLKEEQKSLLQCEVHIYETG